jgi:hypothetical protein
MDIATRPSVLFVYYTYTQQTLKVVETMAGVLRDRGSQVVLAGIEFIDARYADRFKEFPMPHPYREVLGMILPELRRATGKIRIPAVVTEREYDLVCIASPTWWLSTNVPIRSFLESEAADLVLKGKRFAVRGRGCLSALLAAQHEDGTKACKGARRRLRGWYPFLL